MTKVKAKFGKPEAQIYFRCARAGCHNYTKGTFCGRACGNYREPSTKPKKKYCYKHKHRVGTRLSGMEVV